MTEKQKKIYEYFQRQKQKLPRLPSSRPTEGVTRKFVFNEEAEEYEIVLEAVKKKGH